MRFAGRSQIESLAKFRSQGFLSTSFFLDADKSRLTKKEITVSAKNLITDGKARIEALDAGKDKKESLARDLNLIQETCLRTLGSPATPGLAVFSCSRQGFSDVLELPHGPRNRLIFDTNFYVRPLSAILDKFSRICAFLISRRQASWYEVFMGQIAHLNSLMSDVPGQVREGGFEGYNSKRIERHIDAHLQSHFKKCAQTTFDFFKSNGFDWLFLGCEDSLFPTLEPLLHTYLKGKLRARLKSKPGDSPAKILKEAVELEAAVKKTEEGELLKRLIAEVERGGLACSGLKETLKRLNQFEVQTLVVTHSFSKEGRACPVCRFLYVDELICPVCQKKTEPVMDVVDEAIESAVEKNCPVKHIDLPSKLDRYGKIGAFLKYKA